MSDYARARGSWKARNLEKLDRRRTQSRQKSKAHRKETVHNRPKVVGVAGHLLPPAQWLVESKSLKLYLGSFRNIGAFHEDCTVAIGKRLVALLKPKWLRIGGYWYPRGGMPIDVFWQAGKLPAGVWVPDQGVPPYRGRG